MPRAMRLGRGAVPVLQSSCQLLIPSLLEGSSVLSWGPGASSSNRRPSTPLLVVVNRVYGDSKVLSVHCVPHLRGTQTTDRRDSKDDFRVQPNGRMGFRFWSSESRSRSSNDAGGPAAVEFSAVLEEEQFHDLADDVLHRLQEKIEVYGEDLSVDGFESDYASGVLTVRLGSLGTYVINKQTPNRQIWLSSPVRFDWVNSKSLWIYKRTDAELITLLEQEFSVLLGTKIDLS